MREAVATVAVPEPAAVPAPAPPISWWRQFRLLVQLQYADYRASAPFFVLFSLVMPLGLMWMMSGYLEPIRRLDVWLVAGNAVLSTAFGTTTFVSARVGWLRLQREIDYYGTLPIGKGAFLAATFCVALLSALPGLVATLLAGAWLLGLPIRGLLVAVPLALLAAFSLTMLGALIGSLVRSQAQLNLYSNLVYAVVLFCSPVLVPVARLPLPLRPLAWLLPTGEAAMALTDALAGEYGLRFWLLTGALVVWCLGSAALTIRRLDWRD